ncbi:AraC family transcriptional regulator [Bacterioplanes sanyensis]|uniref:AraC family transcriptional regulator n=1 Tax=Bacterioplanes sanyensis TaxID=1249553 RepID=A0A222FR73_9GAMM|nr:helix-turn-helix domain-containing protein [Bacterioplanes sanyensis]ASP40901.1 AraC family transcriptional regulator [Bacterioplanes sanyensis]
MKKVAVLTYNGAALFELGCAVELFGLPRPEFDHWYQCQVITFEQGPLVSTAGVGLSATVVDSLNGFDTLVIPSWPTQGADIPPALSSAIQSFYDNKQRILSFCSGSFLLAQLGLLNGKQATTHWRYAQTFKTRFPQVQFVDNVLYLLQGNLGCSAGSAAALDLGIEVIRQDYGSDIANAVARRLVLSAHRQGGQSQFADAPVMQANSRFSTALDWAVQHLSESIDIDQLANKANMSRRTFDRKFRANFNLSPKAWLTEQRIQLAKSLLEQAQGSVDEVALKAGFDHAGTLRHHFRKALGVSPTHYRQQFLRSK